MKKLIFLTACIIITHGDAIAQNQKYHLFNPVPRGQLRDMSTDRPDITESPYSVDAGHFQLETDLFKTARRQSDGITAVENNLNVANLKLGLSKNIDLQLIVANYVNSYEKDANGNKVNKTNEFGDLTLRLKYNLWGNDDGKTAFAMMPYLNIPTSKSNSYTEAGIVFPFAVDLGNSYSFGTQVQFDVLKSVSQTGYHGSILQSATVGKELTKSWETFIESYYVYDFEEKQAQASFNGGLAYSVTPNVKFDVGFNLGMTKNTDKVYFIGFSFRY
jgi:hypothetical protein